MAQTEVRNVTLTTRFAVTPWAEKLARSRSLKQFSLVSTDVAIILLGFIASSEAVQLLTDRPRVPESYPAALLFALLWVAALSGFGTYALQHTRAGSTEYKRTINATLLASGTMGVIFYLVSYEYPRLQFTSWIIVGLTGLCVVRFIRRRFTQHLHIHGLFTTEVLIAGSSDHVDEVARVLQREKWIGYSVRGAITDEPFATTRNGVPVLGKLNTLPEHLDSTGVPLVVFAEGSFDSPAEFRRLAWHLEQSNVQMALAPTLADVSAQRLEFRPVAGLPLVDVAQPTAAKSLRWLKRTMDILGSAILLLLASPILLATMLAIKLEDGGPVFFRQPRVGLEGQEFACLKLRSMCVDAEARLAALKDQNEGAGVLFKMKDDPRITKVGKFIRRYSIDELPQLWNTLVGDMSLVGPRPALPKEVALYDDDTRRRLRVRPGLTGLWQVSGRSSLSWEDTVRLDLYYVDNWSLVQDMMILLKTAKAVVGSDGAY